MSRAYANGMTKQSHRVHYPSDEIATLSLAMTNGLLPYQPLVILQPDPRKLQPECLLYQIKYFLSGRFSRQPLWADIRNTIPRLISQTRLRVISKISANTISRAQTGAFADKHNR